MINGVAKKNGNVAIVVRFCPIHHISREMPRNATANTILGGVGVSMTQKNPKFLYFGFFR
jgi:hypothetical protein